MIFQCDIFVRSQFKLILKTFVHHLLYHCAAISQKRRNRQAALVSKVKLIRTDEPFSPERDELKIIFEFFTNIYTQQATSVGDWLDDSCVCVCLCESEWESEQKVLICSLAGKSDVAQLFRQRAATGFCHENERPRRLFRRAPTKEIATGGGGLGNTWPNWILLLTSCFSEIWIVQKSPEVSCSSFRYGESWSRRAAENVSKLITTMLMDVLGVAFFPRM